MQQAIAQSHGMEAKYTLSVQETSISGATPNTQQPSLMALLQAGHFTLPIFHSITLDAHDHRFCQLRAFPTLDEIEAVQHLLQARMPSDNRLH
jgi:hypothetical protein